MLKNLGAERAWVVHGSDGLDEITTSGPTSVAALENGKVHDASRFHPKRSACRSQAGALRGGDAAGERQGGAWTFSKARTVAFRDVALLNAAAALVVAGKAKDLKEGVALATKSVDSGEAEGRLDRLIAVSNDELTFSPRSTPTSARRSPRRNARRPLADARGDGQGRRRAARLSARRSNGGSRPANTR